MAYIVVVSMSMRDALFSITYSLGTAAKRSARPKCKNRPNRQVEVGLNDVDAVVGT